MKLRFRWLLPACFVVAIAAIAFAQPYDSTETPHDSTELPWDGTGTPGGGAAPSTDTYLLESGGTDCYLLESGTDCLLME